jgi:hypothetical protein
VKLGLLRLLSRGDPLDAGGITAGDSAVASLRLVRVAALLGGQIDFAGPRSTGDSIIKRSFRAFFSFPQVLLGAQWP